MKTVVSHLTGLVVAAIAKDHFHQLAIVQSWLVLVISLLLLTLLLLTLFPIRSLLFAGQNFTLVENIALRFWLPCAFKDLCPGCLFRDWTWGADRRLYGCLWGRSWGGGLDNVCSGLYISIAVR